MEDLVPTESESPYAAEGTAAHALAELKARHEILGEMSRAAYVHRLADWRRAYNIDADTEAEMDEHTDSYVALLKNRLALFPDSTLMLEQRMDTGIPHSWGTSDAVIVSPVHVEIIDFKYGQGVPVEAEGNPQLRLYALGALDTYGDILGDTEIVRITVHQPRLRHILTDEMTPQALREWREEIVPIAKVALTDHAPFGPSADACRWCPASGHCVAQFEHVTEMDFGTPFEIMSEEDLAYALSRVEEVKIWLAGLEVAALDRAYSQGKHLPGYKVVKSGGNRKIVRPEEAIKFLLNHGFTRDEVVNTKIRGIGELEALIGKTQFTELLGPYVERGEGRPSLVPEDDKRDSIQPNTEAAREFSDDIE